MNFTPTRAITYTYNMDIHIYNMDIHIYNMDVHIYNMDVRTYLYNNTVDRQRRRPYVFMDNS